MDLPTPHRAMDNPLTHSNLEELQVRTIILVVMMISLAQAGGSTTAVPIQDLKVPVGRYSIVQAESSISVQVFKTGALSFLTRDHNMAVGNFSGAIAVTANGTQSTGTLEASSASLWVTDKISESDKREINSTMRDTVLEAAKFPRIAFQASGQPSGNFNLTGDLTLHGVTKRISLPVVATWDTRRIRLTGKYILKQTDFGITPYSTAGGTVRIKNEVEIRFSVIAK